MSLTVPLQVALCLAFIFAMFSLLVMAVQELVASFVKLRARTFVSGLRQILGAEGTSVSGSGTLSFLRGTLEGSTLYTSVVGHPLIQGGSTRGLPSYASSRSFSTAMLDILSTGAALDEAAIRQSVDRLPDGPTKTALSALLNKAGGKVDAFRTEIEQWFDDAMDRVSGTYKRWSQGVGLVIGLLLATLLNVDTIAVTSTLWSDAGLRSSITAVAESYQAKAMAGQESNANIQNAVDELDKLKLPIGRSSATIDIDGLKILGWTITALASSFGAPFWFDILQRLVNLRGAGPKPPRVDQKPS